MKSTGEVMGIADDFPTAFGKAQAAAGVALPLEGSVFISVCDTRQAGRHAARRAHARPRLPGARDAAAPRRRSARWASRSSSSTRSARARRTSSTASAAATSTCVINTPVGRGARTDGWEIRRAAVEHGIPCITTMTGASAAARAIGADALGAPTVRSLQELHAARTPSRAAGRAAPPEESEPTAASTPEIESGSPRPSRARACWRRSAAGAARWSRTSRPAPTGSSRRDDPTGPTPLPGQFYMLAAADGWGGGDGERPYLARAFSVCRVRGARLDFLSTRSAPAPRGSRRSRRARSSGSSGPLGIGFSTPPASRSRRGALLVGGGIGIAPLVIWARGAREAGHAPTSLLGFRSAGSRGGRRACSGRDVELATDDGSAGHHGLVTDLLERGARRATARVVYACGPPAMLEAVRRICAERSVPAQLALEEAMACGFGACFGCVVRTRDAATGASASTGRSSRRPTSTRRG